MFLTVRDKKVDLFDNAPKSKDTEDKNGFTMMPSLLVCCGTQQSLTLWLFRILIRRGDKATSKSSLFWKNDISGTYDLYEDFFRVPRWWTITEFVQLLEYEDLNVNLPITNSYEAKANTENNLLFLLS